MTAPDLLITHIQPDEFTKFTQNVLAQKVPKQVLECLSMISELMATEFGKVIAQKFTRYGIKDLICQFTQEETVKAMNQGQGSIPEMNPAEKLKFIQDEKARQAAKILQIKKSLDNGTI